MLSSFLRRLLFAREFSIMEGKVELMGTEAVMFPKSALIEINNKAGYNIYKNSFLETLKEFSSHKNIKSNDMFNIARGLYESFGLGKIKTISENHVELEFCIENAYFISAGAMAGIFSYINCKNIDVDPEKLKNGKYELDSPND